VSNGQPSASALNDARALVRALSSSLQTYGLYPPGHPSRREGVQDAVEAARRLVAAADEPPVLFLSRRSLYLGPTLMARESLVMNALIDAFTAAGIEALELLPNVGEQDIDALVLILVGDRAPDAAIDGILVNRIRPEVGDGTARDRHMSELIGTYGLGLEHLRHSGEAVAHGQAVDLNTSLRVVEQLADRIQEDPTQALLATTVKSFDEYTYYHMVNVCILSLALGHAVGLEREQMLLLGLGALLHDLGKVKVPKEVLLQPGELNEEQWRLIQRHPVDGAGLIFVTSGDLFHPAASIVLEHHSAFDLGGYPSLSGRPHPSLPARLVAVADVFDAVTTKRSYREAEDRQKAMTIINSGSGKGFDPNVVSVLSRLLGAVPVGSLVKLSTGFVALVVRSNEQDLSHPVVRLVLNAEGHVCEPEEIDLSERASNGSLVHRIESIHESSEFGLDMTEVLQGAGAEPADEEPSGEEPGLVHEPGPSEVPPAGYVDTHNEDHEDEPLGRLDTSVAPPTPY
jgi:HD-GYP domain-containing protein (c-di-GMP phosphodiesterase class II)